MYFPPIYTIGLCSFGKISSKGLIIGNTKKKIANANITAETINNIFLFINSLMIDLKEFSNYGFITLKT
jgi:hypothetical protein